MQFSHALIATVALQYDREMQAGFAFFKQAKVMLSAFADGYTVNLPTFCDEDLNLQGMLFLFARIIVPLLFLGRSTGLSPTSTTIIFPSEPLSIFSRAFLPGSRNAPL